MGVHPHTKTTNIRPVYEIVFLLKFILFTTFLSNILTLGLRFVNIGFIIGGVKKIQHLSGRGTVDIHKIEILIRAIELGSMSKAAKEFLYTPSAVSHIFDTIENEIGIRVKVTLVEPKSLPRFEGKAKRVIDERNLH